LSEIPRDAWDRLLAASPQATPFARWSFHRAWWDAYGSTAHDQYLVCGPAGSGEPGEDGEIHAIVPLMHRHEAEPEDDLTATVLRRHHALLGTPVPGEAKAIFFGASYHADYATLLCAPADVPAAAHALAETLTAPSDPEHSSQPWDVVDLRRLRAADPVLAALQSAFDQRAPTQGWQVIREPEDVCPVITIGDGEGDWDAYLATLDKKARHEIRRKLRRAQGAGELSVEIAAPTPDAIEGFIDLHTRRFGDEGLFPPTEGGARSRRFVHRLAELESAEPDGGLLHIAQVRCGQRLIYAALAFDDGRTCYLYNAGMDPDAADLSPGVTGTALYLRNRLEAGRRRFDFLRGAEEYKYEWGAQDEVIERLLVVRGGVA
jgi:CelD/BcsL family acetyltransferase involved in cellulose biosynthesis